MALRQTDAAVQEGLKAIDSGYRQALGYAALAAFYEAADKAPEAKVALAEAMKLNPKLSVAWFHAHNPVFIETVPGFREALIKAGLPEE
jgi:predicted Zn-dependent protease